MFILTPWTRAYYQKSFKIKLIRKKIFKFPIYFCCCVFSINASKLVFCKLLTNIPNSVLNTSPFLFKAHPKFRFYYKTKHKQT